MGEQRALDEVWTDDIARIIGPLRDRILRAFLRASDPDTLSEIEVVFFVDDERTWGVRFEGSPYAVQYATDLVLPIVRPKS